MDTLSYPSAYTNLASIMQKVCTDSTPIVITHDKQPAVVLLSLAEYTAIQETLYLLQTPQNAQRLITVINQLE